MNDSAFSEDGTGWWQRRRAQRRRLRELTLAAGVAENDGTAGELGGLIAQQRRRGHIANARALWIFAFLILTLLAGLAYYIAVPLWLQWQASSRSVYEARADLLGTQLAEMDAARNGAWGEIIGALDFYATAVDSQVEANLTDLRVLGGGTTLVALGDGAITRSTDGGETWVARDSQVEATLSDLRVLGDGTTLVAIGVGGAITRSTDGGETWAARESQVEATLRDLRVLGDGTTLVALGDGVIARSTDGGETWAAHDSQVEAILFDLGVLGDGTTLVAVGGDGAIIRSTDGGETWAARESQVEAILYDLGVIGDGTTLVAVGVGGAAAVIDNRYAKALQQLVVQPGSVGDDEMWSALAELPVSVPAGPVVRPLVEEFERAIEDRTSLEAQRDAARAQADEIRAGGFSLGQRRQDFAQFMESCRGADGTTEACTDAYVALRNAETQTVWQILAERAPQAILLLFLLATLGGLYRYNMRLAGFHHSRADALELFGSGKATDTAVLAALSEALAADKVEFGKGNTPSDQAVEIAKAIVSRRS